MEIVEILAAPNVGEVYSPQDLKVELVAQLMPTRAVKRIVLCVYRE